MLNKNEALKCILIFKDKDKPGMRVAAELHKLAKSQHFQIKIVADPSKLRQMLEVLSINAVVIDVGRESGDTLTALRILEGFPAIPLFIFNGFLLPRIAEKSLEYDHVQYCEDYNNLDRFIAMILEKISKKRLSTIHGIDLGNFLQLMNSEKFSGQIIVTSGAKRGEFFLRSGQLISASMNDASNKMALAEMSSWKKVTVEIEAKPPVHAANSLPPRKSQPRNEKIASAIAIDPETHAGRIDILRFSDLSKKISVNIHMLNSALQEVQDMFADELLRTDIFLTTNGRSLAGWNSQPLACSQFAAITKSLKSSLQISQFPPLGDYYLLDLDADQLLFVVVTDELQWGFLLMGTKKHLGLLLKIVLPKALAFLEDAITTRYIE
ncbi:MAG: DUF4388 domain-containing protein [Chrysiogenales bacterium]